MLFSFDNSFDLSEGRYFFEKRMIRNFISKRTFSTLYKVFPNGEEIDCMEYRNRLISVVKGDLTKEETDAIGRWNK